MLAPTCVPVDDPSFSFNALDPLEDVRDLKISAPYNQGQN